MPVAPVAVQIRRRSQRQGEHTRPRHGVTPRVLRGTLPKRYTHIQARSSLEHVEVSPWRARSIESTAERRIRLSRLDPNGQVKGWIKEVANVENATIMVTELKCKQTGCPPFETIMVIMGGAQGNQKRRIHCRLVELTKQIVTDAWAAGESEEGYLPPGA